MIKNALIFPKIILALSSGILISLLYFNATHSLSQYTEWSNFKTSLHIGVKGSESFMEKRLPLAHHRLNLGAFWGSHWLKLDLREKDFDSFQFDFKMVSENYLNIIFATKDSLYYGIRLSHNKKYPGMIFSIDKHGRFHSKEYINSNIIEDRWDTLNFQIKNQKGHISSKYLPKLTFALPQNLAPAFGFWTGPNPVLIDNIELTSMGEKIDAYDFNYTFLSPLLPGFVLLFLFLGIKLKTFQLIYIMITLTTLNILDYTLFQGSYKEPHVDIPAFVASEVEKLNELLSKETYDVFFIGSSVTQGRGASAPGFSFFDLLQKDIKRDFNLTSINLSMDASRKFSFKNYLNNWKKYKPKLVIFVFMPFKMKKTLLKEVLDYNRENGIKTLVLIHPFPPYAIRQNYGIQDLDSIKSYFETLKAEFGESLIHDYSDYLLLNDDQGIYHWDNTHYTDYAHQIVQELFYPHIRQTLRQ